MTSRRTKISPKSGRGLDHVTATIFGSTVGYPSDSLASCSSIPQTEHSRRSVLFLQPHCVSAFVLSALALLLPSYLWSFLLHAYCMLSPLVVFRCSVEFTIFLQIFT